MKSWFQSKTLMVNLVALALGATDFIIAYLEHGVACGERGAVLAGASLVNIALRFATRTPVAIRIKRD